MVVRNSGFITLTFDSLYVANNKAYILVKTNEPNIKKEYMQYVFVLAEVKKRDIANVTELITLD